MKLSSEKKLKIIEPFFKKEKKLIEIEEETNIPYSTLKRWVRLYKGQGEEGLEKKTRTDKNTFKNVDEESMSKIEALYKKNYSLPKTKIYKKAQNIFENSNISISYPTFFRILNNLDEYIVNRSDEVIKKEEGLEYGLIQKVIPLPFYDNKNKLFYLTIFYEKKNLQVVNFLFEEPKRDFIDLLDFIRKSILISEDYPRYISIDSKFVDINKNLLKNLFFETDIQIVQEEAHDRMLRMIGYLDLDILKEFSHVEDKSLDKIREFIKKYLFIESQLDNYDDEIHRELLNPFLKSTNRKVYNYGVRIKNEIYFSNFLPPLENGIVKVFYGDIYRDYVYIYFHNQFLGKAYKQ